MKIPEHEEVIDELCLICKGISTKGEVCHHCNDVGTTKWPKRCGGDCSQCEFPPENPKYAVGDTITYGVSGKAKITSITYQPCWGNVYNYEGGGSAEQLITKIESGPTLNSFFKDEGGKDGTHNQS